MESASKVQKEVYYRILAIFLIWLSFVFLTKANGWVMGQDSLTYHLPVTRYVAKHNKLPEVVPYDLYYHKMSKPPLLYLITAPLFKLFGANEKVAEIVPLTSLLIFLFLMSYWLKDYRFEAFLFSLILSFFTIHLMTWFYQGCLVILFSAVTYYFIWKSFKEKTPYLLDILMFGFLSAMSKTTGLATFAFATASVFLFLIKYRPKNISSHEKGFPGVTSLYCLFIVSSILLASSLWFLTLSYYISRGTFTTVTNLATTQPDFFSFRVFPLYIFHLEFILATSLLLANIKHLPFEDKWLGLFFVAIFVFSLLKSFDPRYSSFVTPIAIYIITKYLTPLLPKDDLFKKVISVMLVSAFLLNPFLNIFNPQHKKHYATTNFRNACSFLTKTYGPNHFVVGDADFGIGWWCKYNFTTFTDYFKNRNKYPKPDFVVDSWWDFCHDYRYPNGTMCESRFIRKLNLTLKPVWSDGKNVIYKVY